jgi:hypothetical protein
VLSGKAACFDSQHSLVDAMLGLLPLEHGDAPSTQPAPPSAR